MTPSTQYKSPDSDSPPSLWHPDFQKSFDRYSEAALPAVLYMNRGDPPEDIARRTMQIAIACAKENYRVGYRKNEGGDDGVPQQLPESPSITIAGLKELSLEEAVEAMDTARDLISSIGTTDADHKHQEAAKWMEEYYPAWT